MFRLVGLIFAWWRSLWEPKKGEAWEAEKEKAHQPKPEKIDMEGMVLMASGKVAKEETIENGISWTVVNSKKDMQSVELLTDLEAQKLNAAGLDLVKALVIKKYWCGDIGRMQAATMINKKGFSESSIKPYYAIFNSALGEGKNG